MNFIIKEDIEKIINSFDTWHFFRGKTVLISGANGFLPAYMVEVLLTISEIYDIKVIGLVRNLEKAQSRFCHWLNHPNFVLEVHDVNNPYFSNIKIDVVIHAASQASPKYYGIDPIGTLKANTIGTMNMLNLSVEHNVDAFLFFSSGEVYGELRENQFPTSELDFGYIDPMNVRSCYAESKRMGENICVSYTTQYNVKCKIVRPFHTYGPGLLLDDGRVYADFVSSIVNKQNIVMKSSGQAIRAFCYISDAIVGFIKIIVDGEIGHVYNIGNPYEEYSIMELATKLVDNYSSLGIKLVKEQRSSADPYLKSQINRNTPNIDKAMKLGWMPTITVDEGFKRTIESFGNS